MHIDTDKWMTASEAARILRVTPERVRQLAEDGSIEAARPWPRVSLVSRESIAAWIAGQRQRRMSLADARRYMLQTTGADHLDQLDPEVVRDKVLEFVASARPRWGQNRLDAQALALASRLLDTTTTSKEHA